LRDELGGDGSVVVGEIMVDESGRRGLFVGGYGEMRVVLVRGDRKVEIWGGGEAVSGWLSEKDELVVGSKEFLEGVWNEGMGEVEMMARMGEMESSAGVVGLVVQVGVVKKMAERVEVEIEKIVERDQPEPGPAEMTYEESAVVKWWKKTKRKIGMGSGQIALKREGGGRRRLGLLLGGVFLTVFIVSVVLGAGKRAIRKDAEEFASVSEPIEYALDEAVRLKEVNAVRARSLVLEAREGISKQGDRFVQGRMEKEWQELVNKVDKVWGEVSGDVQVNGERWLGLGIFKEGVTPESMDVRDGSLILFGSDERVVIRVLLSDKSGAVVAGGQELGGALGVAGDDDGLVVLTGDELVVLDGDGGEVDRLDLEGVRGKLVETFGINAYVLADEDLFKFPGTGSEYGKRRRFLNPGTSVNTSKVLGMMIDGDVWLLSRDGEVVRLSQGLVTGFELKRVEDWVEPRGVMASEELSRVWVWDRGLGAVVEFDRESGEYLRKLVWEGFRDVSAVALDETGKRLMVVKGEEVWAVGM